MSSLPAQATPAALEAPAARPTATTAPANGWILSPTWDLLLLANVLWPLIALAVVMSPSVMPPVAEGEREWLPFLQLYLLSAPHRLITVPMVLLDARHMANWRRFALIAACLTAGGCLLAALGMAVPYGTSTLMYLMIVDFAWNAWHFASQHAGIARIYGRKAHPEDTVDDAIQEKATLRIMVLWVFMRVGMWHGMQGINAEMATWIANIAQWFDPLFFLAPAWLLLREIRRVNAAAWGRIAYIGSAVALYGSMLVALRIDGRVLLGLFVAHACFHAIEYFAVIGWAASKKKGGAWEVVAPQAAMWTVAFVFVVGLLNWGVAAVSLWWWGFLTLLISYIHYAWDGMIWKAPTKRVSTAPV